MLYTSVAFLSVSHGAASVIMYFPEMTKPGPRNYMRKPSGRPLSHGAMMKCIRGRLKSG